VGPIAGLDTEARGKIILPLPGIEPRSPGRPAHILIELPSSAFMQTYTKLSQLLTAYRHQFTISSLRARYCYSIVITTL
jgi:hypothetical protein